MRVLWYLVGFLREAWGKFGRKLGKNYLIPKRLVGETFMNLWKNIYPWSQPQPLEEHLSRLEDVGSNGVAVAFDYYVIRSVHKSHKFSIAEGAPWP